MSNSVLTAAGAALVASCQLNQQLLNIDKIVFADIPGLDTSVAPGTDTVMPDAENIVHECAPSRAALANAATVVYSAVLDSDLGDFYMNFMGLYCSEHDVLVAACVMPRHRKYATGSFALGNTLIKNFALGITDVSSLTGIAINAETWQIDFTARLVQIDERERLSNFDIYGTKYFFDNGFSVVDNAGTYELQTGTGYVDGIRIDLDATQTLDVTANVIQYVYADACLNGDITGVEALWTVQISDAELAHYIDAANQQHYVELLAIINADGTITDERANGTGGTIRNTADLIAEHEAKSDPHTQYWEESTRVGMPGLSFTDNKPAGSIWVDGSELPTDAEYDALNTYLNGIYGTGGNGRSLLPEPQGLHFRIVDDGRGVDPDAASRADRGDGTTGDNVGTIQDDDFKAHTHDYYNWGGVITASEWDLVLNGAGNYTYGATSSTGGNETRGKNMNVRVFIYYK